MSESPDLPLDIVQNIVDILVNEGLQYVKAVSLTCKSFLPFCRKHIFSSIEINTDCMRPALHRPTAEALKHLLETPAIAKYVRRLAICTPLHPDTEFESLAQVAQRLTGIQSLTVWFCSHSTGHSDWNDIPLSTRRSLLALMHLPTLTRLSLRTINNFPISNLLTCINIKHLSAQDIHISGGEHDEAASSLLHKPVQLQSLRLEIGDPKRATLLAARCPSGRPAIDFTDLQKISIFFYPGWSYAGVSTEEIFRKAQGLVEINLEADDNTFRDLELAKIVTPSLQTLRRLALTIFIGGHGQDPLAVICDELEPIGKNGLESIDIEVELNTDEDCWKGTEWGRLEKALDRSGWPMLRHISLVITIYSSFIGCPFGMVLKSLPQTQFTDFTSRKNLDFQFSVKEI